MSKLSSLEPSSTQRHKQVRFGGVAVESTPEGDSLKGLGEVPETPMTPNTNAKMTNEEFTNSRYESGYGEGVPSYKAALREITRKHIENMRPHNLRKNTMSASKIFKERLMSRVNDRMSYIAN